MPLEASRGVAASLQERSLINPTMEFFDQQNEVPIEFRRIFKVAIRLFQAPVAGL